MPKLRGELSQRRGGRGAFWAECMGAWGFGFRAWGLGWSAFFGERLCPEDVAQAVRPWASSYICATSGSSLSSLCLSCATVMHILPAALTRRIASS